MVHLPTLPAYVTVHIHYAYIQNRCYNILRLFFRTASRNSTGVAVRVDAGKLTLVS